MQNEKWYSETEIVQGHYNLDEEEKIYWQIRNEGGADSVEKKRWWVISMLVNNYISWSSFAQSFTTADLLSCKPSSLRVGNT